MPSPLRRKNKFFVTGALQIEEKSAMDVILKIF